MSESAVYSESNSMHFWGICCESGKQYAQVVGQRFRITMAVLDPKSFQNDSSERIVSLIVLRNGIEYILCVLKHGEIHQVNLNLIFDRGENVKFYIKGHGKVYLSGYQLTESQSEVTNDENGYLCPLKEVKSKNRKSSLNTSRSPMNIEYQAPTSSGKKTRNKDQEISMTSYLSEPIDDDDDDDPSDEDFRIDKELSTESAEEDISSESEEITDDSEIEESSDDSEMEELTATPILQGSQKRKRQEKTSSKKRTKNDSCATMENADDVICIEEKECNDKNATPSAGNQSSHKEQLDKSKTVFSEKKAKKEKKIKEILQNVKEHNKKEIEAETPTPATPSKRNKNPLQKLEGGVEIQDVINGNGPIATKGKMLHVFFVGRLPDKQIFDARLPGEKPFSFRLGKGEVIKGWEIAFEGMRVGGRRKIKVPSHMAYGKRGRESMTPNSPSIPPNTTLCFVVDLQSVS